MASKGSPSLVTPTRWPNTRLDTDSTYRDGSARSGCRSRDRARPRRRTPTTPRRERPSFATAPRAWCCKADPHARSAAEMRARRAQRRAVNARGIQCCHAGVMARRGFAGLSARASPRSRDGRVCGTALGPWGSRGGDCARSPRVDRRGTARGGALGDDAAQAVPRDRVCHSATASEGLAVKSHHPRGAQAKSRHPSGAVAQTSPPRSESRQYPPPRASPATSAVRATARQAVTSARSASAAASSRPPCCCAPTAPRNGARRTPRSTPPK